jgi:hypothetical protein
MHVDLPIPTEIERLLAVHGPACVSIYLPTTPDTDDADAERIAWKNLTSGALGQLVAGRVDKRIVTRFEELFDEVDEDGSFWFHQANTLAVFTDGESLWSYHLPNRLEGAVKVADRLFVKPLLRAVTFPQACFVLALAQGSVRLLEVGADFGPYEVAVEGMPADVASFAHVAARGRSDRSGMQPSEEQKIRARQYARAVERAVRNGLRGHDLPLILAATEPTDSMYRSVNTLPQLVGESIDVSPERVPDHEIASAARTVLDRVQVEQLRELHALFDERAGQRRVSSDLADIARASTYGMVDTLVVDIDAMIRGRIDDAGGLEFTEGPEGYDVVDEMARRVMAASGDVVAVRSADVPRGGAAAAILRYS